MSAALARAASLRPDLFWWAGAPAPERLAAALAALGAIPDDLASVWAKTGGGTAFESEEILSPVGSSDAALSVAERMEWHRASGLPSGLCLFHEGCVLSAVRPGPEPYVVLSADYSVESTFGSFDEWFQAVLLSEYAGRYGLARAV